MEKKYIKKYRLATLGSEPGDKKVIQMCSAIDHLAIQTIDFKMKASYYYKTIQYIQDDFCYNSIQSWLVKLQSELFKKIAFTQVSLVKIHIFHLFQALNMS